MWRTVVGSWFSFLVQCNCLTLYDDLQLPRRLEIVLRFRTGPSGRFSYGSGSTWAASCPFGLRVRVPMQHLLGGGLGPLVARSQLGDFSGARELKSVRDGEALVRRPRRVVVRVLAPRSKMSVSTPRRGFRCGGIQMIRATNQGQR